MISGKSGEIAAYLTCLVLSYGAESSGVPGCKGLAESLLIVVKRPTYSRNHDNFQFLLEKPIKINVTCQLRGLNDSA